MWGPDEAWGGGEGSPEGVPPERGGEGKSEVGACAPQLGDPAPGVSCSFPHGKTGGRDYNSSDSATLTGIRLEYPTSREVCPTVRSVELAPGVMVTQACDGHICLGVPLGTEAYVKDAALATIRAHEPRMRAIVHLANHEGPEVCQDKVNIARQTALHMVRFSANARDVFLLRALGSRVLSAAAEAHDRQIRVTTAAVLAQVQLQPVNDAAQAAGR